MSLLTKEQSSSILIDLHCHSSHSDGAFTPEKVAQYCAEANVAWAALADHNTLAGQLAFHAELSKHSIGYVSAIELTCFCGAYEVHILGYGFDCNHQAITALVNKYRTDRQSLSNEAVVVTSEQAIAALHTAGGVAIIAHPVVAEGMIDRLIVLLDRLVGEGIDGIEINQNAGEHEDALLRYAESSCLCISMGTDFHGEAIYGPPLPGIACPYERWSTFRQRMVQAALQHDRVHSVDNVSQENYHSEPLKRSWTPFLLHIVTPVITVIALFVLALFFIVLPTIDDALHDRKREMIRELTNAAISILDDAYRRSTAGDLSEADAKNIAALQVAQLRYGAEGKDYFWIQDCTPTMIMHPYRLDLNGKDLSGFTDKRGVYIFKEFVDIVEAHGDGYAQYVWQWMDNPERIEPKESYVRIFKPWNWIVGTGIYMHDVQREIDRYRVHLLLICSGIGGLALLLLLYVLGRTMDIEKKSVKAESALAESHRRNRILVDAATEGALFVSGNRCRYANRAMLVNIGCADHTIEIFTIEDIFPATPDNTSLYTHLSATDPPVIACSAAMQRADGSLGACTVTVKNIPGAPDASKMLLVRYVE